MAFILLIRYWSLRKLTPKTFKVILLPIAYWGFRFRQSVCLISFINNVVGKSMILRLWPRDTRVLGTLAGRQIMSSRQIASNDG